MRPTDGDALAGVIEDAAGRLIDDGYTVRHTAQTAAQRWMLEVHEACFFGCAGSIVMMNGAAM